MECEEDNGDRASLGGSERQQSPSQPSPDLQVTPQMIQISPDDLKAIAEMSLSTMVVGNYLVIVKSDFDIVISEEPYLALMILLNTMTGRYIARVWNQTVYTGMLNNVEELKVACSKHFELRPCLGFPVQESELEETEFDFIVSFSPVPSKISKSCLKVRSKDAGSEIQSCSECLKLKQPSEESPMNTTEEIEMPTHTNNMPFGSGLWESMVKKESQETWHEEYNNSHNSDKLSNMQDDDYIKAESMLDIELKEKIDKKEPTYLKREVNTQVKSAKTGTFNRIGRQPSFKCFKCDTKGIRGCNFKSGAELVEHMVEEDHVGPVMCPRCQQEYHMTEIITHYEICLSTYKKEQRKRQNDAQNYRRRKALGMTDEKINQMDKELQMKRTVKHEPQSPRKCPLCEKVLSSHNTLWRHKVFTHHMGSFKCLCCDFGADDMSFAKDMVEHMIQNHANEPLVRCPSCKEKLLMTDIVSHYENCPRIMEKERRSIVHKMQINEKGEVGPYRKGKEDVFPRKCALCDTTLLDKNRYWRHMRVVHHGGNFNCQKCKIRAVFAKDLVQHMEDEKHTDEPFVLCPQCFDKHHMKDIVAHYEVCITNAFKNMEKADRERKDKPRMCQTCGKTFSGHQYYQHMKMHAIEAGEETPEVYFCDQCGRQFMTKGSLRNHIQVEHDKKEFECKTCHQTFKTHNKRDEHQILIHSTDEKYNCKFCGKRFGNIGRLKGHITYYHEEPKFKCQFCGKMFKVQESLEGHERMHKGEKPFPCTHCVESFTCKKGLAQHMRGVHKIAKRGGRVGWGHSRKEKVIH